MRDRPEYLQKPPSARCFHNALPPSLTFSFPALTLSFHEMGIDPHGTHGNKDTIDLNAPCASLHYSNKNNETAGGLATPMNRGLGCVEYCTISSSNIAVLPTPLSLYVYPRACVCARACADEKWHPVFRNNRRSLIMCAFGGAGSLKWLFPGFGWHLNGTPCTCAKLRVKREWV